MKLMLCKIGIKYEVNARWDGYQREKRKHKKKMQISGISFGLGMDSNC